MFARIFVALVGLGLVSAMLAFAAPARAQEVTIPFAPELGAPYVFEVETWKEDENGRKSEVTLIQSLTFTRDSASDGYLLTFTIDRAFVGAERREMRALGPLIDLFGEVIWELDQFGYPERVTNWDAIKVRLVNVIPIMAEATEPDPAKRAQAEEFFRRFMDNYLELSPEDAVASSIKFWPSLIGNGGVIMEVGVPFEDTYEQPSPLTQGMIKQTSRYVLLAASDTVITLEAMTLTGASQVSEVVEDLLAETRGEGAQLPEETRAEIAALGFITETVVTKLDATSGVVRSAQIDRGVDKNWERVRIRRIEP